MTHQVWTMVPSKEIDFAQKLRPRGVRIIATIRVGEVLQQSPGGWLKIYKDLNDPILRAGMEEQDALRKQVQQDLHAELALNQKEASKAEKAEKKLAAEKAERKLDKAKKKTKFKWGYDRSTGNVGGVSLVPALWLASDPKVKLRPGDVFRLRNRDVPPAVFTDYLIVQPGLASVNRGSALGTTAGYVVWGGLRPWNRHTWGPVHLIEAAHTHTHAHTHTRILAHTSSY